MHSATLISADVVVYSKHELIKMGECMENGKSKRTRRGTSDRPFFVCKGLDV